MNRRLILIAAVVCAALFFAWHLSQPEARSPVELARDSEADHTEARESTMTTTGPPAPAPVIDAPPAPSLDDTCASVLAGPEPGAVYRYAVDSPYASGQQLVLSLTERSVDHGVRLDIWHFQLSSDGQPDVEGDLPRHCDTTGEAEPWGPFGVPGLLDVGEPSWRWPARLQVGDAFEGVVASVIDEGPIESPRHYRVAARERVRVPAGDFDCLRVDFTESLGSDSTAGGSLWVAEGVGLIRSRRELPRQTQTMELLSIEQAS